MSSSSISDLSSTSSLLSKVQHLNDAKISYLEPSVRYPNMHLVYLTDSKPGYEYKNNVLTINDTPRYLYSLNVDGKEMALDLVPSDIKDFNRLVVKDTNLPLNFYIDEKPESVIFSTYNIVREVNNQVGLMYAS